MIIDLTIKNFRSIKTEQLFSLYVEKSNKRHTGNISYVDDKIGVLKTAAVFGANASGKTNLILAVRALSEVIVNSGDLKDGDHITSYQPYRLAGDSTDSPTHFDIEFFVGKTRYRYQIEFDAHHVLFEKLDRFNTAKASNIFTRNSPTDWKSVKFGDSYKGGKRQFAFFANNAYLSKAGNSPESPEFIREIYRYFRKKLLFLLGDRNIALFDWENKSGYADVVNAFLSKADLGISRFEFVEKQLPKGFELPQNMPMEIREQVVKELTKQEVFYHTTETGELVAFDKELESRGTRQIFQLAPLFTMALSEGITLFIDEIETSLHPHIAELVLKLFNDPVVNTSHAQLIFTTHDLTLMSQDILRKDQIFLSEKSPEVGTQFTSLDEFDSGLKDASPFMKWYGEGRLGGIPEINYREISSSVKEAIRRAEEEKA